MKMLLIFFMFEDAFFSLEGNNIYITELYQFFLSYEIHT